MQKGRTIKLCEKSEVNARVWTDERWGAIRIGEVEIMVFDSGYVRVKYPTEKMYAQISSVWLNGNTEIGISKRQFDESPFVRVDGLRGAPFKNGIALPRILIHSTETEGVKEILGKTKTLKEAKKKLASGQTRSAGF